MCQLKYYGSSIGEVLGWDGLRFNEARKALFKELVKSRMKTLMTGELEADDIHVFVKQEPHKIKKLREEKYRLISAVSMVDTMVDRVVFGDLADEVLTSVGKTPVMVGWTPVRGGFRLLRDKIKGRAMCIDKSSWDWTVPGWMVDDWESVIFGLVNEYPKYWPTLVRMRFRALFEAPWFGFEDGTRVQQQIRGIMKSGCFLTIVLNSLGQLLVHYLASARMGLEGEAFEPLCMGDDTVQELIPQYELYVEEIERLGFIVKECKITTKHLEFAGFVLEKDRAWPCYWEKHIYNMQHSSDLVLEDMLFAYMLLYPYNEAMNIFVRRHLMKWFPKRVLPVGITKAFMQGDLALHIKMPGITVL